MLLKNSSCLQKCHHPKSNGTPESAVKIMKSIVNKANIQGEGMQKDICTSNLSLFQIFYLRFFASAFFHLVPLRSFANRPFAAGVT